MEWGNSTHLGAALADKELANARDAIVARVIIHISLSQLKKIGLAGRIQDTTSENFVLDKT